MSLVGWIDSHRRNWFAQLLTAASIKINACRSQWNMIMVELELIVIRALGRPSNTPVELRSVVYWISAGELTNVLSNLDPRVDGTATQVKVNTLHRGQSHSQQHLTVPERHTYPNPRCRVRCVFYIEFASICQRRAALYFNFLILL